MKTQLRKVKFNKGTVEGTGQTYDYTRIFVEVPIYDRSEKEFGVDVVELEYGTEADYVKLAHLRGKLPCLVEVEFMPVKKGNGTVNVVTHLEILEEKSKPILTVGTQTK